MDKELQETLKKIVKNYNLKLTRVKKRAPLLAELQPLKTSMKEERERLEGASEREVRERINELLLYSKRGAEKLVRTEAGVITTNYMIDLAEDRIIRINERREKLREQLKPSTQAGSMGLIRDENLREKKNNIQNIAPESFKSYVSSLEGMTKDAYYDEKKEQFREGMIAASYKYLGGGSRIDELISRIENADMGRWYELQFQDYMLQINFTYSELGPDVIINNMIERLDYWGL